MRAKHENLIPRETIHFAVVTERMFLRGPLLIDSKSPEREISYVKRPL